MSLKPHLYIFIGMSKTKASVGIFFPLNNHRDFKVSFRAGELYTELSWALLSQHGTIGKVSSSQITWIRSISKIDVLKHQ